MPKITIEATDQLTEAGRLWLGETETGIKIGAVVHVITTTTPKDNEALRQYIEGSLYELPRDTPAPVQELAPEVVDE
jgi:hypothetical protein